MRNVRTSGENSLKIDPPTINPKCESRYILLEKQLCETKLIESKTELHSENDNAKGGFLVDAKRRLSTFASNRLRHLLKMGQPFNNNFVSVKISNRSRSLRLVETFHKLSLTLNFVCFASLELLRIQCTRTFNQHSVPEIF